LQLGVFTDTMNLFQVPPADKDIADVWVPDDKTRPPWKTAVMQASMSLGILWMLLALIGVPWRLFCAVRNVFNHKLQREDVVTLFGIALFLVIFLPIPFVRWGALFGYWTPRLILPALISFFLAGFLLIDKTIARNSERRARIVFALVALQCAIEAVMLI
jgi:cytochrome b561